MYMLVTCTVYMILYYEKATVSYTKLVFNIVRGSGQIALKKGFLGEGQVFFVKL